MSGLLSSNENVGIAFLVYDFRSPYITQNEGSPKERPNCKPANVAGGFEELAPLSESSLE